MDQTGATRIGEFIRKYRSVFLILLAGIALMLLPVSGKATQEKSETAAPVVQPDSQTLQDQLAEILSQMEGAGRVKVLLTVASGEKTVYQTDQTGSGSDTVILTDSSRNQMGMVCQIDSPIYQGAVIVCQGADRPAVRLAITQAVSSATGLGYDKISILKMK